MVGSIDVFGTPAKADEAVWQAKPATKPSCVVVFLLSAMSLRPLPIASELAIQASHTVVYIPSEHDKQQWDTKATAPHIRRRGERDRWLLHPGGAG